jgi:hypothetical protein
MQPRGSPTARSTISFPPGFLPPDPLIDFSSHRHLAPQVVFIPDDDYNRDLLNPEQVEILCRIASGDLCFPGQRPESGRSLHGFLDPAAGWRIPGVQMKGGAGLIRVFEQDMPFQYVPIQPEEEYQRAPVIHYALMADMELKAVPARRKSTNCISYDAACRQTTIQRILCGSDESTALGMPPLLKGRLCKPDGRTPLLDINGQQIQNATS